MAPNRPTMPVSMYCISIEDIWAKIAGRLSIKARRTCWPSDIRCPSRIIPKSMSFCPLAIFPEVLREDRYFLLLLIQWTISAFEARFPQIFIEKDNKMFKFVRL